MTIVDYGVAVDLKDWDNVVEDIPLIPLREEAEDQVFYGLE
jgi:hypothetical protein